MEIIMQWLDELDDLVAACAAKWDEIRRAILGLAVACLVLTAVVAGGAFALRQPAFAPFFASMLLVAALYRRSAAGRRIDIRH